MLDSVSDCIKWTGMDQHLLEHRPCECHSGIVGLPSDWLIPWAITRPVWFHPFQAFHWDFFRWIQGNWLNLPRHQGIWHQMERYYVFLIEYKRKVMELCFHFVNNILFLNLKYPSVQILILEKSKDIKNWQCYFF